MWDESKCILRVQEKLGQVVVPHRINVDGYLDRMPRNVDPSSNRKCSAIELDLTRLA